MRTAARQMRDAPPMGDRSRRTRSARVRDHRRRRAQQGGKAAQGCRSMTATNGCARIRRINQREDVSRISQRAVALERQHQRIFERYRSAAKARYQAAAPAVKKPPLA
jgi:hypothetical protein